MKTAWAISSGQYSDYRVSYIVDGTEEDAKRIADELSGTYGEYGYESFEVIPGDVRVVSVLRISQSFGDIPHVLMRRDEAFESLSGTIDLNTPALEWSWNAHKGHGTLAVSGTDHERVRKVFSDRAAMYTAQPWAPSAKGERA